MYAIYKQTNKQQTASLWTLWITLFWIASLKLFFMIHFIAPGYKIILIFNYC